MKSFLFIAGLVALSTLALTGVSKAETPTLAARQPSAFESCVGEQRYAGETQERAEANCSTPDPSRVRPTRSSPATAYENCVAGSVFEGDTPEEAETNCFEG